MLKKRMFVRMLVCLLLITSLFAFPENAMAAAEGSTMATAREVVFGQTYYKEWTRDTDHLNHYCRITVPARGMITINATKPFDSEGEYGRMTFTLYSEDGEAIWDYGASNSKNDARDSYIMKVGLDQGVYYLTILPGFRVYSGTIETYYSVSFRADPLCEVEPNNSLAEATALTPGKTYAGCYGYDHGRVAKNDYYKFNLTKGKNYKIAVGNYAKVEGSTTLIYLIDPNGSRTSVKGKISLLVDDGGMNYMVYTPALTGVHYLCFDNYSGIQFSYSVRVSAFSKSAQTISGLKSSYTLAANSSGKTLHPKAVGEISVTSSDRDVAAAYYYPSSGELKIRPWKIGKATITVTAAETGLYKKAVKKITVTVIPRRAALVSVKNLKGMILQADWDTVDRFNITGYQLQVSLKKDFSSGVKTFRAARKYDGVTIDKSAGWKKNKTYYVRVRSYKRIGKSVYYSRWSTVKKVTMKK